MTIAMSATKKMDTLQSSAFLLFEAPLSASTFIYFIITTIHVRNYENTTEEDTLHSI